jgi:hypothetical protein
MDIVIASLIAFFLKSNEKLEEKNWKSHVEGVRLVEISELDF